MNRELGWGVAGCLVANGLYLALALRIDSTLLYLLCLPLNGVLVFALLWLGRVEAVRGVLWTLVFTLWLGGACIALFMVGAILI
ncbi:MAG: hypothetical protein Kow0031_29840 [Anaerolineae bacterium]